MTVPIQLLRFLLSPRSFFDFLINSYSFSVQRIGRYCRDCIEPVIKDYWSNPHPLWEEYMNGMQGEKESLHFLVRLLLIWE